MHIGHRMLLKYVSSMAGDALSAKNRFKVCKWQLALQLFITLRYRERERKREVVLTFNKYSPLKILPYHRGYLI